MKNGVLILRKAHFLNCIPCARHWPMLFTSIISSYSHSAPMRQALLSSFFYMQGCWSWDLLKVTQQVSGNKWHSLSDLRTILLESLCPPPKMMHYISSSVLQLIIIYARQTNPSVILYFHIYHCHILTLSHLSLSHVWLFATPWTAAYQASLSFTISQSCSNSCLWGSDAIQPSHPSNYEKYECLIMSYEYNCSVEIEPVLSYWR